MRFPGICCVIPLSDPSSEHLARLETCLASLRAQSIAPEMVDIVIAYVREGKEAEPCPETLHALAGLCMDFEATLVFASHELGEWAPALTRNIGGRWSRRVLVTFIDLDAVMHPLWAEAVWSTMQAANFRCAVTVRTKMTESPWQDSIYRRMLGDVETFENFVHKTGGIIAIGTGCATVTTTELYERLGGLDEAMVGYGPTDLDFTERLASYGVPIVNLSETAGLIIAHQAHDRPHQDIDPAKSETKRRNTIMLQERLAEGRIRRNADGWGGLPW